MKSAHQINILALAYHQLKTHTIAIRGYCELLIKEVSGPLTEKQEWYVASILNHITEMFATIDNFLQAARLEGESLFLKTERVNPEMAVEDVINSLKFLANARNATLIFDRPGWKAFQISTDPVILKQILINLIYNSCKYHRGRGEALISLKRKGKFLEFSVKDNGIGIPNGEKRKIFTKFFRGRKARLIDAKGHGLGLYVTKSMVKALGGNIGFKSQPEKGSNFWFTIPIK